jgi:hypothetical protein
MSGRTLDIENITDYNNKNSNTNQVDGSDPCIVDAGGQGIEKGELPWEIAS